MKNQVKSMNMHIFNMTNLYTFIFTFLCVSYGMTQETNKIDATGKKQGLWVVHYEGENAKNIKYEGVFIDGKPSGVFKYYYPNGERKAKIENEERGVAYGFLYHDNGMLMAFGKYLNQQKDSIWTYFDQYGYLVSKTNYIKDTMDGQSLVFYPLHPQMDKDKPLRVMEMTTYKMGLQDGAWVKYYEDQSKMAEGKFENGYKEGRFTTYYGNGMKETVIHFKHSLKNGYMFSYDENGDETTKIYFINDKELKGEALERHLEKLKQEAIERAKSNANTGN